MKTAIRLQNHGCTNHPYWWIVVAANRKNLKGRFLEHVGYWSPRQGVALQRQIVLNVPRIKHWISSGAVPTEKVQKFLSLWSILPRPWFQQRTPEELQALRKPESEWTDKDRAKEERKRKRREREKLQPVNYYRRESMYKGAQYGHLHKYENKLREKIHAAERENQILRELLLHNEFHKLNRINELAGKVVYDDGEELARLEKELARAKAELALLDRSFKDATVLHKIKAMQEINKLVDRIREVERERHPFRKRTDASVHQNEEVSQFELNRKLEYELVTHKIERMNEEFAKLDTLHDVVTLEEYANHLVSAHPNVDPARALQAAEAIFMERGRSANAPLTKFDLYFERELARDARRLPDSPLPKKDGKYRKRKIVDGKVVRNAYFEEKEKNEKRRRRVLLRRKKLKKEKEERVGKSELELKNLDEIKEHNKVLRKIGEPNILKYLLSRPDVLVPTNRPVHPFPDLEAYIPEEYYEPITTFDINIAPISSLEPKEELDKYHQKRHYSSPQPTPTPEKPKKEKKGKKEKRSEAVL